MPKTKKRKFPGPWRKRYEEFKHFVVYPMGQRRIDIAAVREVLYVRTVNQHGDKEESRQTEQGPRLQDALRRIHLSDRQESIHLMLEEGLTLVEKIFQRYSWYLHRKELEDRERRKIAYRKRRAELAEKREEEALRKKAGKQFCRRIEV